MLKFTQFLWTFKELQKKSAFLKIPVQAYEAGRRLEVFSTFSQDFGVFEAYFLIKVFLLKKTYSNLFLINILNVVVYKNECSTKIRAAKSLVKNFIKCDCGNLSLIDLLLVFRKNLDSIYFRVASLPNSSVLNSFYHIGQFNRFRFIGLATSMKIMKNDQVWNQHFRQKSSKSN